MKRILIKENIWTSAELADSTNMKEIIAFIQDFGMNFLINEFNVIQSRKMVLSSHDIMEPEANDGHSTIKVYDGNNLLWQNGESG